MLCTEQKADHADITLVLEAGELHDCLHLSLVFCRSLQCFRGVSVSVICEVRPVSLGKDYDSSSPWAFFPTGSFWDFSWKVVLCGLHFTASFPSPIWHLQEQSQLLVHLTTPTEKSF